MSTDKGEFTIKLHHNDDEDGDDEDDRSFDVVAPLTIPVHAPGSDVPLRYATHDVVTKSYADEPMFGYNDEYVAIRCPACDRVCVEHGFMKSHVWSDYEMHVSMAHRGEKYARVTLEHAPRHAHRQSDAGRHFRRNVDLDSVDLLSFDSDGDGYDTSYTAVVELGHWRGDLSNERLAHYIPDAIELDEFDSVDVEWHHDAPSDLLSADERIERAANGNGGDN